MLINRVQQFSKYFTFYALFGPSLFSMCSQSRKAKMDITDQNNYTRQSTSTETEEQRCQRHKRFSSKFYTEAIRKTLKFCAATPMKSKKPQKKLILLRI
ncbi:hypothetical protein CDAR_199001 [Caerostris darwini]|uniref:Secreted protein n=1 Tax=Caerostris darwini TaxID=1538125 RepID=A0AAV4TDE1_9ARAC|nr:hypothetical protein CDAR_199001 [Caerostris darwini]